MGLTFFAINRILELILMEHIESYKSLKSKLFFESISSIRILSVTRVIDQSINPITEMGRSGSEVGPWNCLTCRYKWVLRINGAAQYSHLYFRSVLWTRTVKRFLPMPSLTGQEKWNLVCFLRLFSLIPFYWNKLLQRFDRDNKLRTPFFSKWKL